MDASLRTYRETLRTELDTAKRLLQCIAPVATSIFVFSVGGDVHL